jgi:hypothetical protein
MTMKLIKCKSLWGMEGTLNQQFELIAKAGYCGVEAPLPAPENQNEFQELLERYQLSYIAQIFAAHHEEFEEQAERASGFRPLLLNSHSAKDDMPYEQQLDFFQRAIKVEKRLGIPAGHETHRGRAMFTPWNTTRLLADLKELKITADFSHWVCVCESLLENHAEHIDSAISRTIHIHTRVGYTQGPQVPDPRAPEYQEELKAHTAWWRKIIHARTSDKSDFMTFTPEYGPPGYLHTLPYTRQPVADIWDVCLWMGRYVEEEIVIR